MIYYVDNESGSDASSGSAAFPWKRHPDDPAAAGTAASTLLAPGDEVRLRGSYTFTSGGILIRSSGSDGTPIVLDGTTWSGEPTIFTSNHAPLHGITATSKQHLEFTGFRITRIGGYPDNDPIWSPIECYADPETDILTFASPHGFVAGNRIQFTMRLGGTPPAPLTLERPGGNEPHEWLYYVHSVQSPTQLKITIGVSETRIGTAAALDITGLQSGTLHAWKPITGKGFSLRSGTGIRLDECDSIRITHGAFDRLGVATNAMPVHGVTGVSGSGITAINCSDTEIEDCDFTRVGTGLRIETSAISEDITVRRCTFHNYMNWLVDFSPRPGFLVRNITFEDCRWWDYKELDSSNWDGTGADSPHNNGAFMRSSVDGTYENILFNRCALWSDDRSSGGTASFFMSEGSGAAFTNCTILFDDHSNAFIKISWPKGSGDGPQHFRMYNCTLIGTSRCGQFQGTPDLVDIRNNVFIRDAGFDVVTFSADNLAAESFTLDYNAYYGANPARIVYTTGYKSLAQWQGAGREPNSIAITKEAVTRMTGAASTQDPTPSEGSPLIGAGQNLLLDLTIPAHIRAALSNDFAGNARHASDAWTIGALEPGAEFDLTGYAVIEEPPPAPDARPQRPRKTPGRMRAARELN